MKAFIERRRRRTTDVTQEHVGIEWPSKADPRCRTAHPSDMTSYPQVVATEQNLGVHGDRPLGFHQGTVFGEVAEDDWKGTAGPFQYGRQ